MVGEAIKAIAIVTVAKFPPRLDLVFLTRLMRRCILRIRSTLFGHVRGNLVAGNGPGLPSSDEIEAGDSAANRCRFV